jgi:hypothetical protein
MELGSTHPSHNDFQSQIRLVCTDVGSLHMYIDMHELNDVTREHAYPVPRVMDSLDE